MEIDEADANVIIEALELCWGDGVGPDPRSLIDRIERFFPQLHDRIEWIRTEIRDTDILTEGTMTAEEEGGRP
jgi:hypothetical protein